LETVWYCSWADEIIITQKVFWGPFFLTHKVETGTQLQFANNVFKRLGWYRIGKV